jgi:ferrochelatase
MSSKSYSQVDAVLVVAHGTIEKTSELPEFLARIRRGRPINPEFLTEIASHYDQIGGSPLLAITREQVALLESELGLPCHLAMRLWHPLVEDVAQRIADLKQRRVLVLPLAPFSVEIYYQAACNAVAGRGLADRLDLLTVPPWGSHPSFIAAWAKQIAPLLKEHPRATLVLTAHSLPQHVIAAGDNYEREVSAAAAAVGQALGVPYRLAFQSQGVDGGAWVGPTLAETFTALRNTGSQEVVVAPIGFLSEHVETLYDLDIEAARLAGSLGLGFFRVSALNTEPTLIAALAAVARETLARIE